MNSFNCRHRAPAPLPQVVWAVLIAILTIPSMDAAEPVQLTSDGSFKRDPTFIDRGSNVVFCVDETADLIRMMKVSLGDSTSVPFYDDANKHQIEPTFSPNKRYIAFTECTGNLTARFVIRDQQEKKDAYVTHSGRGGTRSPAFFPDSSAVVYAFAETGPQQLWSVDVNGKNKKQLTESEGINNWPSFTPDGTRLIFASSRDRNYEIYSMKPDGSDEQRLTKNTIMDIRPTVSPDGKQIAFTSTRDNNYEIYVMDIDGKNPRRLTRNDERDDYPAWHPNGHQLAIVSERGGRHDIYLVDVPSLDDSPPAGTN